jgi:hypothetical protein
MPYQNRFLSAYPPIDWADEMLVGQTDWWLANEGSGERWGNIVRPTGRNGVPQSGVLPIGDSIGRAWSFDGGATSSVELGTRAELRASGTAPFTLAWMEYVGQSPPTFAGLARFFPNGNTQCWLLFRDDGASYGRLACSLGGAGSMVRFSSAPTLAAGVGVWRHCILQSVNGMNSTTLADWTLIQDGVSYTASASSGALSSQIVDDQRLGWDGADSKWKGRLCNFRRWNRLLSAQEKQRLYSDPWAGLGRSALYGAAAANRYDRMFAAM